MKKSLGGRKLTKRRINKDVLLLKKFKNETVSGKDILQTFEEKILSDTRSVWFGSDIMYIVETLKKGKVNNDNEKNSSHKKRYLVMLRKKGFDLCLNILLINFKDGELELKSNYDTKFLRAVDFGSDDNELMLSFDSGDQNVYFTNQNERDETVWIIVQSCKGILCNEVTVGYSIDFDSLGYKTTTNGTLSRFPILQKLVSGISAMTGDIFSDEEAEAEHLLDELNWTVSSGSTITGSSTTNSPVANQLDLQHILSKQSDQLNCEIIDFLLQWEEMDEKSIEVSDAVLLKSKAGCTEVQTSSVLFGGVRDTREVLTALSLVNSELEAVDRWLGEQIERLSEIQTNLHIIEDESGALETSWQNLNIVQQVVGAVVHGYSIDAQHQDLLARMPEEYFSVLLRPASTSLAVGAELIRPLNAALSALREALDQKIMGKSNLTHTSTSLSTSSSADTKVNSCALSPAQWKQIQTIAAVTSQHTKLTDLADAFCSNYGDFSLGLFDTLLKHKALIDGSVSIVIKQFNYQSIIERYVSASGEHQSLRLSFDQNQFLLAQRLYHVNIELFAGLLDHFVELSPNYARPLCEAYVRATQDRLLVPLAKILFKDLHTATAMSFPAHRGDGKVSLANCSKYHLNARHEDLVLQKFHFMPSSVGGLSAWMAVRVALLLLSPVIENEEKFVKSFFHLDARQPVKDDVASDGIFVPVQPISLAVDMTTFANSKLSAMLESLFEGVVHRFEASLLHCSDSVIGSVVVGVDKGVNGVEVVAMLTVLHQFQLMYPTVTPFTEDDHVDLSSSIALQSEEPLFRDARLDAHPASNTLYLTKVLQSFKQSLSTQLNLFVGEQVSWINAQKSDPKAATVQAPFARFPTLILQLFEMTDGLHFEHVDDVLHKLAKELFNWLSSTAKQSDKYADKIKIINFTFFERSLQPMCIDILDNFISYAAQQRVECMARYVNWMVSYEFPALSALAVRMDGLGNRVNEEELSLYIRRKDVLNVVKEVEVIKTLEVKIAMLRRRLEKHFQSEQDTELNMVSSSWTHIKQRVVRILTRLEEAASASYQIQLDVGPKAVMDLFDKYSSGEMGTTSMKLTS